jgi:hypothetical protein
MLLNELGDGEKSNSALREGVTRFGAISGLSDWELGWYVTAARMVEDEAEIQAAEAEQRVKCYFQLKLQGSARWPLGSELVLSSPD